MFGQVLRYVVACFRQAFPRHNKTRARLFHLLYASAKLTPELPPTMFVDGQAIALCQGGLDGGAYLQVGPYCFVHGAQPEEAISRAIPLLVPVPAEHEDDSEAA